MNHLKPSDWLSDISRFVKLFDHTLLRADATDAQVDRLCDEALRFDFAAVCVNTSYVPLVAQKLHGSEVLTCCVVGFPLGAMATACKVEETLWATGEGAQEVDTVIQAGAYLSGRERDTRLDIAAVVRAAGEVPVKVILETSHLKPDDIRQLTKWCSEEGAAFVKTSTGFGSRGASVEDVSTMAATIANLPTGTARPDIKASGGIRALKFVEDLVRAGATRIGSSSSVSILEEFAKARGIKLT